MRKLNAATDAAMNRILFALLMPLATTQRRQRLYNIYFPTPTTFQRIDFSAALHIPYNTYTNKSYKSIILYILYGIHRHKRNMIYYTPLTPTYALRVKALPPPSRIQCFVYDATRCAYKFILFCKCGVSTIKYAHTHTHTAARYKKTTRVD